MHLQRFMLNYELNEKLKEKKECILFFLMFRSLTVFKWDFSFSLPSCIHFNHIFFRKINELVTKTADEYFLFTFRKQFAIIALDLLAFLHVKSKCLKLD